MRRHRLRIALSPFFWHLCSWNCCVLGNIEQILTLTNCLKYRTFSVCRKAIGKWGLVFSLERNKWAALLRSHCLNRKCESVLLLLSFTLPFFSSSPLPLPLLYWISEFIFIIFLSISDKVLSDLIHPHCWILLRVKSGPQDFWEDFSYNWGHSKIILWQVENEAVISPGSTQHKGRGPPSSCSISF